MTQPQHRWSIEAVDTRLADPQRDLDALAAELELPAEEIARFAKVRDVLLAGRASTAAGGRALDESDLVAAGVVARDIVAYLKVGDTIRRRYMAECWGLDSTAEAQRQRSREVGRS